MTDAEQREYDGNLSDLRKSVDKSAILFILNRRKLEIREQLEEEQSEIKTSALRGGIFEIRSLIDLIDISSQTEQG